MSENTDAYQMPSVQHINTVWDQDCSWTATIRDGAGAAIDISSDTIRFEVKAQRGASTALVENEYTTPHSETGDDPENGQIVVGITLAQFQAIAGARTKAATFYYAVRRLDIVASEERVHVEGMIRVFPTASEPIS